MRGGHCKSHLPLPTMLMRNCEETIFPGEFHKSDVGFYWILLWFHLTNQGQIWHWVKRLLPGASYIVGEKWNTKCTVPFDLVRASRISHIKSFKKEIVHCSEAPWACLTERSSSSSRTFSLESFLLNYLMRLSSRLPRAVTNSPPSKSNLRRRFI